MLPITVSALYILWVKNPLHAVFGLILVFINSAIFLWSLDVNFVALVYVVLYVGAICAIFARNYDPKFTYIETRNEIHIQMNYSFFAYFFISLVFISICTFTN
jgi:NADH:ubiquinone oxidoreductase subunit 6 (subunit J)